MNRILTLTIACFAGVSFAAEKKRVVVCTVTTGFRHSSIPFAEKTLEKLGAESGAYEIVGWARQSEVNIPKKPEKPKAPKPLDANADDKAKAKFEAETKKFAEAEAKYAAEMAKWGPHAISVWAPPERASHVMTMSLVCAGDGGNGRFAT